MKRFAISLVTLVCFASAVSASESFQLTIPFRESSPHQVGEVRITLALDAPPAGAQLVVAEATTIDLGQTATVDGDSITFEEGAGNLVRITYKPLSKFNPGDFCVSPNAASTEVMMRFSGTQDVVAYRMSSYSVGSAVECSKVFKRVGDFPAAIFGIPDAVAPALDAAFLSRHFLDVVLVLDRSGSMNELPPGVASGASKAAILKSALAAFIAQWQEIDAPLEGNQVDLTGDRIGVVFFDSTATAQSIPGADAPENFFVQRGANEPGPGHQWNAVSTHIDTLSPGGSTSIGGGINEGMREWLDDPDNDLVVVLVTDGKQNAPPLIDTIADDILTLDPIAGLQPELRKRFTPIQTVGFGLPAGVDQELLERISVQTNGLSFIAIDAETLFDAFGQTLVNILKGNTISSALRRSDTMTSADPSAPQPLIVDRSVPRVVVSVQWAPPLEGVLDLEVLGRDGTVMTPTSISRTGQAVIQRFDIRPDAAGDWSVRVKRARSDANRPIPYTLNAFLVERDLEYRVRLEELSPATGDSLPVQVNVSFAGKPLAKLPGGAIRVRVQRPPEGLGTILHDTPSTDSNTGTTTTPTGDTATPYQRKVDRIADAALLARITPRDVETITLRDSGNGDGLYSGTFSGTTVPGLYAFEVLLDWDDPRTGHVRRTERLERHLKVRPDPIATTISITPAAEDGTALIAVTPRDRFGNYVGPGYGSRVRATLTGPGTIGSTPVDRDQTGTYVYTVSDLPVGTRPDVAVVVDGVPIEGSAGGGSIAGKWRVFFDVGPNARHDGLSGSDGVLSANVGIERRFSPSWSGELIAGMHTFQRSSSTDPNLWQLTIGGKKWFGSGKVHPFLGASAGVYRLDYLGTKILAGASAGAGLLYDISPRWGVEGVWNVHAMNATGGNITFSTLQLGVRFGL